MVVKQQKNSNKKYASIGQLNVGEITRMAETKSFSKVCDILNEANDRILSERGDAQ